MLLDGALNTSGQRGGHQFIAVNPKLEYFVSKRFINHSIIIKSCQTYPEHIVMCHNAKTGVTATLSTIIFEPKTAAIHERQTRFAIRHHKNTSSNKNKIFVFLPDTLAVRLLSSSFAFNFCELQLSDLQIYFKAYA